MSSEQEVLDDVTAMIENATKKDLAIAILKLTDKQVGLIKRIEELEAQNQHSLNEIVKTTHELIVLAIRVRADIIGMDVGELIIAVQGMLDAGEITDEQ